MENTQSNIKYLKDEPIKKAIAHLSIPMMIGMSAGTIYNVINAYFIGLVHDTAMLSAITLGLPIFTGIMAISQGCLYIPMVIVLHYYFGLHGLVWSLTITEVTTCLIGAILYISYSKKIMKKGLNLS